MMRQGTTRMPRWVRYSVMVYVGLALTGSLAPVWPTASAMLGHRPATEMRRSASLPPARHLLPDPSPAQPRDATPRTMSREAESPS